MENEAVLLVASKRASQLSQHEQIVSLAEAIFGEASVYIPNPEHEVGWPGSANAMFAAALKIVEQELQDAMLWLEPDAIPLCPGWYYVIKKEWSTAEKDGKHFLGGKVTAPTLHMTGVAVYGPDWTGIAPSLVTCPDTEAFDVHSADEVVPEAQFTTSIQHVFRRHEKGWVPPGLHVIDDRAVIFHQDKQGKLIHLMDQRLAGGRCATHPLFSYQSEPGDHMTKFYHTANATKAVKSHGKSFTFEPLPSHGGAVPGVLTTDNEADQLALDEVAMNPTTGVTELSQEEWEEATKKKFQERSTNTSGPLKTPQPPQQLSVRPTPSKRAALLVEEPVKSVSSDPAETGTSQIADINDVLKIDEVEPPQTAPDKKHRTKPRASQKE